MLQIFFHEIAKKFPISVKKTEKTNLEQLFAKYTNNVRFDRRHCMKLS